MLLICVIASLFCLQMSLSARIKLMRWLETTLRVYAKLLSRVSHLPHRSCKLTWLRLEAKLFPHFEFSFLLNLYRVTINTEQLNETCRCRGGYYCFTTIKALIWASFPFSDYKNGTNDSTLSSRTLVAGSRPHRRLRIVGQSRSGTAWCQQRCGCHPLFTGPRKQTSIRKAKVGIFISILPSSLFSINIWSDATLNSFSIHARLSFHVLHLKRFFRLVFPPHRNFSFSLIETWVFTSHWWNKCTAAQKKTPAPHE